MNDERPLLDVRWLEVTYNGVAIALQGVSLSVRKGTVTVLLGRNGAGKTTTLRAATGFLPIDAAKITDGEVRFDGQRVDGLPPHAIAQLGMALVPERDKVFRTLTVEENLLMVPERKGGGRPEMLKLVNDLFPALAPRRRQLAGYLSGGEIQMLAIAKTLLLEPTLLLADEVSLGIAPSLLETLMAALRRINRETGMTILMAEQTAAAALAISDYAYVMESGAIVFEGTPLDLTRDETLVESYLGLGQGRTYAEAARLGRRARR